MTALIDADFVAQPIYLACVMYSVFRGGVGSGLASTAIVVGDALIRAVAVPLGLDAPLRDVKVVALACLIVVLVTGHLKRRADRVGELSRANHELAGQLVERARTQQAATALAAMSREIAEPFEPRRVHQSLVSTIVDLVDAHQAMLYWLDPTSQELVCVATAGSVDETRWLGQRMAVDHELAARAIHDHQVLAIRQAGEADARSEQTLAMPLRVRGKILGAVTFDIAPDKAIVETDVQILSVFAGHAALALENAQLYEELRVTLAKLSESQIRLIDGARLRATEEMAAGVAHHVNNRLMVILTGIQLLMSKLTGDEHRRSLEVVERAALNTAWLIERLRRFTLGRATEAAESADLNLAVRRALEICEPDIADAESRGAAVDIALELGSIPRVVADEAMLEEALSHVLRNAIEAVAHRGTVTITTWASGDAIICAIVDTGAGMPGSVARRATEPFFTTKGPLRVGLGLSSALGIMRQMGAQLEIESTVAVGTRVTIRLKGDDS